MTNDLFDSEIIANQKSFVVIVISDRFKAGSQLFLESLAQAMEGLVDLGVRVGWVDILDDGELIKETFDIDRTPSGVYIHQGNVYTIPWPTTRFWTTDDLKGFVDSFSELKFMTLRPRVQRGLELYEEYAATYLSQHYFEDIFTSFLQGRKFFRDVLDYDYDFKSLNKDFGKRNIAKKS